MAARYLGRRIFMAGEADDRIAGAQQDGLQLGARKWLPQNAVVPSATGRKHRPTCAQQGANQSQNSYRKKRYFIRAAIASITTALRPNPSSPIPHIMAPQSIISCII